MGDRIDKIPAIIHYGSKGKRMRENRVNFRFFGATTPHAFSDVSKNA